MNERAPGASRRDVLATMAAAALTTGAAPMPTDLTLGPPTAFSFDELKAQARRAARSPYQPPQVSSQLQALDFDAIGQVRYRREAALWRDGPGDAIEFFHLGRYARTQVAIHVVEGGQSRPILYTKVLFDIPPGNPALGLPGDLGFAGFRVLNRGGLGDWIAYLGASYFRAAAPFNQYGLSARGIAIDTASPRPEEFPAFTAFWLGHDVAGDLVVHALLEGRNVTGAYRISHRKTAAGVVQDIEAELNFRDAPLRLGLAPLTSMFWYGPTDRSRAVDWRPQIHDSDGLAMWTGAGERIWRPLGNPPRVVTNAFQDTDPRGFGLMQRDRTFNDYQDDGAFYDRRPSLWVEPVGPWGAGSVQLVEIPTGSEVDDNIVAFWVPARTPAAGERLALRYRLYWGDEEPMAVGVAKVVATRIGVAGRPGQAATPGARKFVIDFAGGDLAHLDRTSGVEAVVTTSLGPALAADAYPIAGANQWRLMIDAALPAGNTLDLRAFLRLKGAALTETWVGQAFG